MVITPRQRQRLGLVSERWHWQRRGHLLVESEQDLIFFQICILRFGNPLLLVIKPRMHDLIP